MESAPDAAPAGETVAQVNGGTEILAEPSVSELSEIRVAGHSEETGTVTVEILATGSINYTSYEPEPSSFVVEIPNVDLSALPSELTIGQAGIDAAEITAVPSHGGGSHARIEFRGQGDLVAKVTPKGRLLEIDLRSEEDSRYSWNESPAVTEEPAATTQAAQAMPREEAPQAVSLDEIPSQPATVVSGVIVEESAAGASIAVLGDGSLDYSSFVLSSPDRVVVDINGVTNAVVERQIDVGNAVLDRVRIAQFRTRPEKVVRVVFDLPYQADHEIRAEGDAVRVFLGQAAVISRTEPAQARTGAQVASVAEPSEAVLERQPDALPAQPAPVIQETAPEPEPAAFSPSSPSTLTLPESGEDVEPAVVVVERTRAPAEEGSIPELTPRAVPSSPMDLDDQIVLFDRAMPEESGEGGAPSHVLIPPGATFQSQTIGGGSTNYRGEKISVTFRDADILEVFFFFSEIMNMNVVPDPDVTGSVNIRLTQVPWDQAFSIILKNQGLDAIEEDRIVRIAKTSKLRQEASERRALKQAQDQEVDTVTFTKRLSYARVEEAMPVIQQIMTTRGKIINDKRTNTLIIQDIPKKRQEYENLLTALDTQTPQVSIEARVVEAIRSFERSLGITWGFAAQATPALGTQTNLSFPHRAEFQADVNLASQSQAGTVGVSLGNVLDSVTLDVTLDAFEADGKVRILSAPKVVTQNNTPAKIEQGVQIPVVTTTATEIEVQYVPASLVLDVTPQITAEQTVIMQIKVENNQPSSTITVGDTPGIVTEVVETQILVRSGTTAVIGGVYKLQETDNELGIPGLRRIPFFGWLFKNKSFEKQSSELLVFLTPRIVTNV